MGVNCPQCGAPVEVLTESRFHSCPFCASSFVIHAGAGIARYFLAHERDDQLAWSALAHFLEENRVTAVPQKRHADYAPFPFWLCTLEGGAQQLIPARNHEFSDIAHVALPAGDLQFIPQDAVLLPTTIPLEAALQKLRSKSSAASLVYVPLYFLTYDCDGGAFHAVASPLDQKVYASARPAGEGTRFPLRYFLMMAGFAAVLSSEGLMIKHLQWRGGAFLATFALFFAVYHTMLEREL